MMKFYLAAPTPPDLDVIFDSNHKNILFSFFYFKKQRDIIKDFQDKGRSVFIDSGAFSALTRGGIIDIKEYIKFIKDIDPSLYAGLDVIGDPIATELNLKIMEDEGLNPLATFHQGGEFKYLYRLIEKYDQIALGGMVQAPDLKPWLDTVWKQILQRKPNLKVHGFGLSGAELIRRYPWHSVDSSSYSSSTRFARVVRFDKILIKVYSQSLEEYLKDHEEFKYEPEMKIMGDLRKEVLRVSVESYIKLMNIIARESDNKDFSYLCSQMDIFDIMPEEDFTIDEKGIIDFLI